MAPEVHKRILKLMGNRFKISVVGNDQDWVMVMGVKVGLDLIGQLQQIACVIIDDQNQVYTSKNINIKN